MATTKDRLDQLEIQLKHIRLWNTIHVILLVGLMFVFSLKLSSYATNSAENDLFVFDTLQEQVQIQHKLINIQNNLTIRVNELIESNIDLTDTVETLYHYQNESNITIVIAEAIVEYPECEPAEPLIPELGA